jgi:hypothetical protein
LRGIQGDDPSIGLALQPHGEINVTNLSRPGGTVEFRQVIYGLQMVTADPLRRVSDG